MAQANIPDSPQAISNELCLLEALTTTPETTQVDLATRAGIAVGTVNWYLQRWAQDGFITVQRVGRWKWRYLVTAEGLTRKRQLTDAYVETSFAFYRRTRQAARRLLHAVRQRGAAQIALIGESEIIDVCRLTCLELELAVAPHTAAEIPELRVEGLQLILRWPRHLHELAAPVDYRNDNGTTESQAVDSELLVGLLVNQPSNSSPEMNRP
jgi:hypothetical protein